jgi:hypothetical protein
MQAARLCELRGRAFDRTVGGRSFPMLWDVAEPLLAQVPASYQHLRMTCWPLPLRCLDGASVLSGSVVWLWINVTRLLIDGIIVAT